MIKVMEESVWCGVQYREVGRECRPRGNNKCGAGGA